MQSIESLGFGSDGQCKTNEVSFSVEAPRGAELQTFFVCVPLHEILLKTCIPCYLEQFDAESLRCRALCFLNNLYLGPDSFLQTRKL